MPIYEYRRPDGTTFDVMQRMSEDPLTHDPDTGVPVERVLHAPAVHFKGSGFYNTDYGTKKRAREMKDSAEGVSPSNGSKSESSSSSKDSGGSDAKPAAAPASSSGSSSSSTSSSSKPSASSAD
jgi:putative FmdB family regulatory protein